MTEAEVYKLAVQQNWSAERRIIAYKQAQLLNEDLEVGVVDGLFGPQTRFALEQWERTLQGLPLLNWRDQYERPESDSYEEMVAAYGMPGDRRNFKSFSTPYPMKLAWDLKHVVNAVTMHKLAGDEAMDVLREVERVYGREQIILHGFDLFGGAVAIRKKRGGSTWSTHAWGVAIDFDPERNQLRWDRTQAYLAKPECKAFLDLWEKAGWTSLGRSLDYDWMHVQRAKI